MMLFTLGGAFAILEAVRNILHPEPRSAYAWAWGVLAGAVVFEAGSLTVALRSLRREAGRRRLRRFLRENRDPTLVTVLLEDSAALASIVVAAAGIGLTQVTANPLWDAVASGIIGIILIAVAAILALETYSLLLGEAAPRSVQQRIRALVEQDEAVEAVVTLDTMHIGPETMLVALQLKFRRGLSVEAVTAAIRRLEERVRGVLGGITGPDLIFIEPARAEAPGSRRAA
jgi:divalent metal cation (Fe/Co/Zn/Cd) transporter